MARRAAQIASVLVGCSKHDFWIRPAGAHGEVQRLELMVACVEDAIQKGCRVLLFPAGFFVVSTSDEQLALERAILTYLKKKPLLVAFGIDVIGAAKPTGGKASQALSQDQYNLFGYVVEQGRYLIRRIAQTGVRSGEVQREIDEEERAKRSVESQVLGGATIGLLLCGEVLSPTWHAAFERMQPELVLHLAHASVVLGGASKESWAPHIERFMAKLPGTAFWAFADHIRSMGHYDTASGDRVSLVRQSSGKPVPVLATSVVDHEIPATIYVHAGA